MVAPQLMMVSGGSLCASAFVDDRDRSDLCFHSVSLHTTFRQYMAEQAEPVVANLCHRVDPSGSIDQHLSMLAGPSFLESFQRGALHQPKTLLHAFRDHHHAPDHHIVLSTHADRVELASDERSQSWIDSGVLFGRLVRPMQ